MTSRNKQGAMLGVALALVVASAGATRGGELPLAWAPNHDDATAGYQLEVLDADGSLRQVLDVGAEAEATVNGLADGVVFRFRVRPYDRWGHRASQPSAEIATLPAPRITDVTAIEREGDRLKVLVAGVNFAARARLASRRGGVRVLSTVHAGPGVIGAELRLAPAIVALGPEDFLVVNPVRRAESFLRAHPELLDVDGSGAVDQTDLALVTAAFGAVAGEPRHRPELDLDGNGVVDGEDLAALRAHLATHRVVRAGLTDAR